MKNKYGNNLRTHYSPKRRDRNCLTRNNSYGYMVYHDNNPINTNPNHNMENLQEYKQINYKLINDPCLNYHYRKKNLNLNITEKEKLNKSFNKINPYYFPDKVQLLEKEKINEKIKNRIHLQREAIKQLYLIKIKNPSEKEKLQKINEFSKNPMISYQTKPPLKIKTLNNYYYREYLIKKYNINLYNKPRKEIQDYYNKCQYQPSNNFDGTSIIHTKGNYIFPNYGKNKKNGKKLKEELDKQIERKKNSKKCKYLEDNYNRKILSKIYNDHENFLNKKKKEEQLNKEKEIIIDNNLLEGYKRYKKNHMHDGEKELQENTRKKMEEEDIQKKFEEKQKKLKTMKNLREWSEINKKLKIEMINENNKEKQLWRNCSELYIIKCKHGERLYKCCNCGKNYTRTQVHKLIY